MAGTSVVIWSTRNEQKLRRAADKYVQMSNLIICKFIPNEFAVNAKVAPCVPGSRYRIEYISIIIDVPC